jgi:hypothetical protein
LQYLFCHFLTTFGSHSHVVPTESDELKQLTGKQVSTSTISRKLSNDDQSEHADTHIELPASTHTLLHTEPICSIAFLFSLGIAVLSSLCLILVLISEFKQGESGNLLDVPTGISSSVRAAQYCGKLSNKVFILYISVGLLTVLIYSMSSFNVYQAF